MVDQTILTLESCGIGSDRFKKKCCCKNTLKYCFTYNIVNYSNSNGALTSPPASIISSRFNFNYPSKNHLGGVVSSHPDTKGGKFYPVQKLDAHGNIVVNDGVVHTLDRRLKKSITDLDASLAKALGLRAVNYFWKDTEKKSDFQIGVIAQELEAIFLDLVNNDLEYKSGNYIGLIPLLIEAIKERQE